MADLVAFSTDAGRLDAKARGAVEGLGAQLNRQGFIERSIVTPLRDRFPYPPRGIEFFQRTDTTTFESHRLLGSNSSTALATGAATFGNIVAYPFVHDNNYTLDRIEFEVTTGVANAVARVGIYSSTDDLNGNPYPASLVVQGDHLTAAAAAVRSSTINAELTKGRLYWAAYLGGTASPTVRTIPLADLFPALGFPSTLGASSQQGLTTTSTYNANSLPTSFPTGCTAVTAGGFPAIWVRYSGVAAVTRYVPAYSPSSSGFYLRRVKMWSASGTSVSSGASYYTVSPQIRTTTSASALSTFDTRTNRLNAGEVFYFGGNSEIDVPLAADSIVETKISCVGCSDQTLEDVVVQFDLAFVGGN